jgi:hypothetical protein
MASSIAATVPKINQRNPIYENPIRKSNFCHIGTFPYDVRIEQQK